MYLVRLALRPWRQSPIQQVLTAVGVGGALFFAAVLNQVQTDLGPVIERIESDLLWTVYLKPEVPARDESVLVDQIRTLVGASARRVELVTKEQFLERLAPKYPELAEEVAHLGTDLETIVPRYVTVEGRVSDAAMAQIRQIGAVERIDNSRDRFQQALQAFRSMRWISAVLAFGLVGVVFLVLWQMGRVHRFVLNDAVNVLKQWGASAFSAAIPDLLSGLMVGAAGGAIAALAWLGLGNLILNQLKILAPALAIAGDATNVGMTALSLLAFGVGLGFLATLAALFSHAHVRKISGRA